MYGVLSAVGCHLASEYGIFVGMHIKWGGYISKRVIRFFLPSVKLRTAENRWGRESR